MLVHGGRPVLAGHSMGGSIAAGATAIGLSANGPEAVVMLDTAIARVQAGARWTWQADPLIFGHDRFPPDRLAAAGCPMTLIRASRSRLRVVLLPGAYHHMMIDKPLETSCRVLA